MKDTPQDDPLPFADHPRERLYNHPQVASSYGQNPGCALVFGACFVGAGAAAILLGMGKIGSKESQNAPPFVIEAVGACFAIAGLMLVLGGVREFLRKAAAQRAFAAHPEEPWHRDRWKGNEPKDLVRGVMGPFFAAGFLFLFLVPFNYFAFFKERELFLIFIVSIFDLALVAMTLYGFYVLGRRIKYSGARLRVPNFPCFLRDPIRLTFHLPNALQGNFEELQAVLRCATQVVESGSESSTLVTYEIYRLEQRYRGSEVQRELLLEFRLPADAPQTDLNAEEPVFWELELKAETPGIDFRALYLLPVYE